MTEDNSSSNNDNPQVIAHMSSKIEKIARIHEVEVKIGEKFKITLQNIKGSFRVSMRDYVMVGDGPTRFYGHHVQQAQSNKNVEIWFCLNYMTRVIYEKSRTIPK